MRAPAVRAANSRMVLDQLADGHAATRAELAIATSLTPQALGPILESMVRDGLVLTRRSVRPGPGRPPVEYLVNSNGSLSIIVIYRFANFVILVSNAVGEVVLHREGRHRAAKGPARLLRRTFTQLRRMLDEADLEFDRITDVTFAVEGRVDEDRLVIHETTSWEQRNVDLTDLVDGRFPDQAVVRLTDSDRAMAAAALRNVEVDPADLVVVLSIMYDTHLYLATGQVLLSSRSGRTGLLAHWPVEGNDRVCRCGRTGCLGTVSSGRAVVDNYEELTGERLAAAVDVIDRVPKGDAAAVEAVRRSIEQLGQALAPLLEMLDPDRLIITGAVGGPQSRGSRQLVAAIRRHLADAQESLRIDVIQPEVASSTMASLLMRAP